MAYDLRQVAATATLRGLRSRVAVKVAGILTHRDRHGEEKAALLVLVLAQAELVAKDRGR